MKMAKANKADMEAALDMCAAMESLHRGYLPEALTNPDDEADERYDERKHAAKVVEHLTAIADRGSLFRVCFGMTVILDPRNEVVDPDADTLEVHPKFGKVAEQRDKLKTICLNIVERGLAASDIQTLRDVIAEIEATR